MRLYWICPILCLVLASAGRAQTVSAYDDFSTASLDASRWQALSEDGAIPAVVDTTCGVLSMQGKSNRVGVASHARIPNRGAVEADALGWSGTNQILQLYSGTGAFDHLIEFFPEGTAEDGTPILHVWMPSGQAYSGASPVPGLLNYSNPTTLRIERNGTTYRFLANGNLVYTASTTALDNDARAFLYGWNTSVGHWDAVRFSGPTASITRPQPGDTVPGPVDVTGIAGPGTASWKLEWGAGASPTAWTLVASGSAAASGVLGRWNPGAQANGLYTLRLTATGSDGLARAYWSPVTLEQAALWEPVEGQVVGGAYRAALRGGSSVQRVRFYDNGVLAGESTVAPFWTRVSPTSDGGHTVSATVLTIGGDEYPVDPVHVRVQRDLFGENARVADNGRGFVLPNGKATVAIGQNNGYTWAGCFPLWANGDAASTDAYVASMAASGVNVLRMFLESAWDPGEFLENPLGTTNPRTLAFWDNFLPICQKYGVTVLVSPWDSLWVTNKWAQNPYNIANGGPCASAQEFITNATARQMQKNRFKLLIDRWGNSTALFGIDVLNESDIWWSSATWAQRSAWLDEMIPFVQNYELQKWGHRHMTTVSTAATKPTGAMADTVYRHPLLDFANTHTYTTAVSNPANIIDPALEVNDSVRYAFGQIQDGRPFMDTEWGPINVANGMSDHTFDNQYYHHFTWAHFASGGAGTGMRWPMVSSDIPYTLTDNMRATQLSLSAGASDIDWTQFRPANCDARIATGRTDLIPMGCADDRQGIVWVTQDTRQHAATPTSGVTLNVSGFPDGRYRVRFRSVYNQNLYAADSVATVTGGSMSMTVPTFNLDIALTIRRILPGDVTGDWVVDYADAVQALRIAAGLTRPTKPQFAGADVADTGQVGVANAVIIARMAATL